MNSLFFLENGFSNHICFNVSVRFNNIIAEQSPNRIPEDQTKKLEFILSLRIKGLGYSQIAKVSVGILPLCVKVEVQPIGVISVSLYHLKATKSSRLEIVSIN